MGSWREILALRARQTPDGLALRFLGRDEDPAEERTYGQLFEEIERLIARGLGADPGERALLLCPPGLEYVAAILACLASGVVAVPAYPPQGRRTLPRLRSIVQDAAPKYVVTTGAVRRRINRWLGDLPELREAHWLEVDQVSEKPPAESAEAKHEPRPFDLALLQYTSGSTGTPKGVMLTQGQLLANSRLIYERFGMDRCREVVSWLPPYHDMGLIGGILQPLFAGVTATLMAPVSFLQSPIRWLRAISGRRDVVSGAPSFAYELCCRRIAPERREPLDLSGWNVAFNGAEPVRADTMARFAEVFAAQGFRSEAFFPCYGLAEATLMVSGGDPRRAARVESVDRDALEQGTVGFSSERESRTLVSCGPSLRDQEVAIVDPHTCLRLPPRQVGEVWVHGPSVGSGYWQQPAATAETFAATLAGDAGQTWLRTGDLGFLDQHELFVVGRIKDLIIVRGRNLHPHDLERTSENVHRDLRPGGCAAFSIRAAGEEQVVVVQEVDPRSISDVAELAVDVRSALAAEHGIAAWEVVLVRAGAVPKTSSGKVRRSACRGLYQGDELPVLWRENRESGTNDADPEPLSAVAERLLELLGHRPVSQRPLVEQGLDSLAAVELQHWLREEMGLPVSLEELFAGLTPAELEERCPATPREVPRADEEPIRAAAAGLSPGQRGLWFAWRRAPESAALHIAAAADLQSFDRAALEAAFGDLVRRHEALRTLFPAIDGQPVVHIHTPEEVDESLLDFREESWLDRSPAQIDERLAEESHHPFDLERGPLVRVRLLHTPETTILLLVLHHIIADLGSLVVMVRELGELHSARREQRPPRLSAAVPHRVFASWLEARLRSPMAEEWTRDRRRRLAPPLPVLELGTDRPRRAVRRQRGGERQRRLDPVLTRQALDLFARCRVTPSMGFGAVFQTLLYRHSGQTDLLVGSPATCRSQPDLASVVGYLVNLLVLRADLSGDPTFETLLERSRQSSLEAFAQRELPFAALVDELGADRDPSRPPLVQAAFVWQSASVAEQDLAAFALGVPGARFTTGDLELRSRPLERRACQLDLSLTLTLHRGELATALLYDADLFDATTGERLLQQFENLLRAAVGSPAERLSRLPLLSPAEAWQLRGEWNHSAELPPGELAIHQCFAAWARRAPDATAISTEDFALSYGELDRRVVDLAERLGPAAEDQVVAVCAERSPELVIALLAVLEAGGAYLPIDPEAPVERSRAQIADAGCAIALCQEHLAESLQSVPRLLVLDPIRTSSPPELARAPRRAVPGERLAYVIYTSGSTGRPKGVMNHHLGIRNRLLWMQETYRLRPGDRVLQKTPYTFDVSVWELFWPLMTGATLVLARPGGHRDPAYLATLIDHQRVGTLHFVPSMLAAFLDHGVDHRVDHRLDQGATRPRPLPSLQRVIASGEALTPSLVRRFAERLPDTDLHNLYGPTEAAVDVSFWPCAPESRRSTVPIGRPIAHTQLHVVDRRGREAPIGAAGELWLGGVQLARGYLGQPRLTAERFVPNPFGPWPSPPGGRLYRTGDLCRRAADGAVEFLGRIDHQVKLRGFRIELGEIEAVLSRHSEVSQAVVLLLDAGEPSARLVACVVGPATLDPGDLRRFAAAELPDSMIPASFVVYEELPTNTSGKVDRRALVASLADREPGVTNADFVAPRTREERDLAAVWSEVLGIERVGREDSYFALGGDSIRALRLQQLARRHQLDFELDDLFRFPKLRDLAAAARRPDTAPAAAPAPALALVSPADRQLLPAEVEDAYPLSQVFAGLVFHSEHSAEYEIYLTTLHLRAPFDRLALQRAVDRWVERHPMLRSTFDLGTFSEPLQLVHREIRVPLEVIDLRHLAESAQEVKLDRWLRHERRRRFRWDQPPLVRVTVHHRSATTFQLSLGEPFLDGWSVATGLTELFRDYLALVAGEAPTPSAPAATPRDHLQLELDALGSPATRAYWRDQLEGAQPGRIARWPRVEASPARMERVEVPLAKALSDDLQRLARGLGVQVKSVLLAAHAKVMALWSGETKVLTGLLYNGRPEIPDGERILGLFLNPVCLRVDLEHRSWQQLIALAFAAERDFLPHRRYPMAALRQEHGGAALFEGLLNFTHFHVYSGLSELPGVEVLAGDASDQTYYELTAQFHLDYERQHLRLALDYSTGAFGEAQARALGESYRRVLEILAAESTRPHHDLAPLSAAGLQLQAHEWNDTEVRYEAAEQTLPELFAAQAARTPRAPALTFEGKTLSYGELAHRVRALARRLVSLGVGPDVPVAVCAERSFEMVIAILAVVEAGGAYLPLDPGYPAARLGFMLEDTLTDTAAPLLLVQEKQRDVISLPTGMALRVLVLETELAACTASDPGRHEPIPLRPHPLSLAYVLYTSGSTGRPKGVVNCHRGIVNRLLWMQETYDLGPDESVLQKTPTGFDVSVWELFWPLLTGARMVLARPGGHQDPDYLADLITREQVTTVHFVPSMLRLFLEVPGAASCDSLRRVIASGESLGKDQITRFEQVFAAHPTELHNLYGPTEAAIDVTAWKCAVDPEPSVPIGVPVSNTRIHLFDRHLQLVPVGAPGELLIGGVQLARGYWRRPRLTAERFVPDPLARQPGDRLYRTGDLAAWRPDGVVQYLGRLDHQIKIHGQRIELGEIEAAILEHPAVEEAVVVVRGDKQEDHHLVAYLAAQETVLPENALRRILHESLPRHMVPAVFVYLAELPHQPNGKIDRGRLPAPAPEPRTASTRRLEELLAQVRDLSDREVRARLEAGRNAPATSNNHS